MTGAQSLTVDPLEMLARLCQRIPTPGLHLTRLYGAYTSDESGGVEVYLRLIDASREGKVPVRRVSNAGGAHPRWSRKGDALFYLDLAGTLASVSLELGADVKASPPEPLIDTCARNINLGGGG